MKGERGVLVQTILSLLGVTLLTLLTLLVIVQLGRLREDPVDAALGGAPWVRAYKTSGGLMYAAEFEGVVLIDPDGEKLIETISGK